MADKLLLLINKTVIIFFRKWLSPVQNSGASGCGSTENLSSGSNPNLENGTTSGTNTSNDEFKPTQLTASILVRHNEDMEKIMIQRHKQERSHNKDRETKKKMEKHTNDAFVDGNEVNLIVLVCVLFSNQLGGFTAISWCKTKCISLMGRRLP